MLAERGKKFTLILFAVILGGGGGGSAPPGSGARVVGGFVTRGVVQSKRRAAVQSKWGAVAGVVQTAEQARGRVGLLRAAVGGFGGPSWEGQEWPWRAAGKEPPRWVDPTVHCTCSSAVAGKEPRTTSGEWI